MVNEPRTVRLDVPVAPARGPVERMARAYVNRGRWIADCPRPHCGSAELLDPWQPVFLCGACLAEAIVDWPRDAAAISSVLAARGNPAWMNWFPAGHHLALISNCPHGQTIGDLLAEDEEHAQELAEWASFGTPVEAMMRTQVGRFPFQVQQIEGA